MIYKLVDNQMRVYAHVRRGSGVWAGEGVSIPPTLIIHAII